MQPPANNRFGTPSDNKLSTTGFQNCVTAVETFFHYMFDTLLSILSVNYKNSRSRFVIKTHYLSGRTETASK